MELRATRQMRRNEQLDKTKIKQAAQGDSPTRAQERQAPKPAPADKLSVSRQALAWLEEQNRQVMEEEQRRQAQRDSKGELDALGKQLKAQDKCQRIAARIMRGDRVPPEDLEYLMNSDPEGYKLAMALRRQKKDPEDCESVLDEDDRNGGAQEAGAAQDVPEASGGSGGAETSPAE